MLFLMEERMVELHHVPFLGIQFSVWRLGPVSVDVFEELSDGPALLEDFISLEFNGQGIRVTPKKEFEDDEFSDAELHVMEQVMAQYGGMNSEELVELTHQDGGLWKQSAEENDLIDDFDQKRANSSNVVIDMGRRLCPDAKAFYEETLAVRQAANMMRE